MTNEPDRIARLEKWVAEGRSNGSRCAAERDRLQDAVREYRDAQGFGERQKAYGRLIGLLPPMSDDEKNRGTVDNAPHRGKRCGVCYWALYDGDWCQNPACELSGKSVGENYVHMTNDEATHAINATQPGNFSHPVGGQPHPLVMPRLPVPGWRWAKCDDCGSTWKETSRDILSPSSVDCPNRCDHGGDTHVWKTERADLARDQSGNLLKYEREILTKGLGHNAKGQPRDRLNTKRL